MGILEFVYLSFLEELDRELDRELERELELKDFHRNWIDN